MAANYDLYTEMFGVDVTENAKFASANTDDGVSEAQKLEDLGVTSMEARELRDLQESDNAAYEDKKAQYVKRFRDAESALAGRTPSTKCFDPNAKKALDTQAREPADGVLMTFAHLTLSSERYAKLKGRPIIDLNKPQSVENVLAFVNKVYNTNFSRSIWKPILKYGVPPAVVNKLFDGKKKTDQYQILRDNIIRKKDANDNDVFKRADIYDLEDVIVRAMQIKKAADAADDDDPEVTVVAKTTPDKLAEPRKRLKV